MIDKIQKHFFCISSLIHIFPKFIWIIVIFLAFGCNAKHISKTAENSQTQNPWILMDEIINQVSEPIFPDRTYNILDFNAVADGTSLNTIAINDAIKKCSQNGGGKVIIPAGKFLSGAIHLDNNVNLHLEEGAEILFSTDPNQYKPLVPTSFEGIELINYSPFIYAYQKQNIAVTGKGTLNGQSSNVHWWNWSKGSQYGWKDGMPSQRDSLNLPRLMDMGENAVPVAQRVFGDNHYLRPTFIEPFECKNVLIQGVKIIDAPFWIIHPFKCTEVIIDGVTIDSHGPNNDGCDPEYSKNVIIKNCTFNTGDDCIAIKAGRDAEGRRIGIKSENIVVQNCNMIDGHGGVVIGSEMSAGVSNVFIENTTMNSPNLDRAIRIKTNSRRGGVVDGVYARNLKIGEVKEAVLKLNMFYATYDNQSGNFIPEIKNILLENIEVENGGKYGILAKGYAESPITNITLKNVNIKKVAEPASIENTKNITLINTYINGILVQSF